MRFWLWTTLIAAPALASPALVEEEVSDVAKRGETAPALLVLDVDPAAHPRQLGPWTDAVRRAQARPVQCLRDAGVTVLPRYQALPIVPAFVDATNLEAIRTCPGVRAVGFDHPVRPLVAQSVPLVRANAAHDLGYTGSGYGVAIIDTGIDYTLPEFGSCTDVGSGGSCRVVYGLDTADDDADPLDCHGHGSNVTGAAAGSGGVAPDADILAYKVFRSTGCNSATTSDVLAALDDLLLVHTTYNVASVNMSLAVAGGTWGDDASCRSAVTSLTSAIDTLDAAGVLVVAAAGNEGVEDAIAYPACLSTTVAVANSYDTNLGPVTNCLNSFCTSTCLDNPSAADAIVCNSNGGPLIDMAAPGTAITAGGFTMAGTSQASPHVAGAAALLAQAGASNTAAMRTALFDTTDTVTDDRSGTTYVYPRLNAEDAVRSVTADCHVGALGTGAYCSVACPCGDQEGDCDSDADCEAGLACTNNVGATYGFSANIDVCLSSCHVGALGSGPYCSPGCPCDDGEGDCDSDADCTAGNTCVDNIGAAYGFASNIDVCTSDCHAGSLGGGAYCSPGCPCADGEGDCDSDADCEAGSFCIDNVGASYGFSPNIDVCESNCHVGGLGGGAYCSPGCPCDAGEGDCDSDSDCTAGNTCSLNVGASYGFSAGTDVCEPADCHVGSPGGGAYCSPGCTCAAGLGDCDTDSDCDAGLVCVLNVGASYGFSPGIDVCEVP